MLYVVIHHYPLFDENADAADYLIGVFDNKDSAKLAREMYFEDYPEIEGGIHSISITPVELNIYNHDLECNVPWLNCNNEWEEGEI